MTHTVVATKFETVCDQCKYWARHALPYPNRGDCRKAPPRLIIAMASKDGSVAGECESRNKKTKEFEL